ncbi:MAG: hypothetical protein J7L44_03010 [Candidatus Diapherotrites archaeon]|nr:hypothetical protein [Candidatus Diapherotrites archaeon]
MKGFRRVLKRKSYTKRRKPSGIAAIERRVASGKVPIERFAELLAFMSSRAAREKLVGIFLNKKPYGLQLNARAKVDILNRVMKKNPAEAIRIARMLIQRPDVPVTLRKASVRVLTRDKGTYAAPILISVLADRMQPLSIRIECANALVTWPSWRLRRLLLKLARNPREDIRLRNVCLKAHNALLAKKVMRR